MVSLQFFTSEPFTGNLSLMMDASSEWESYLTTQNVTKEVQELGPGVVLPVPVARPNIVLQDPAYGKAQYRVVEVTFSESLKSFGRRK